MRRLFVFSILAFFLLNQHSVLSQELNPEKEIGNGKTQEESASKDKITLSWKANQEIRSFEVPAGKRYRIPVYYIFSKVSAEDADKRDEVKTLGYIEVMAGEEYIFSEHPQKIPVPDGFARLNLRVLDVKEDQRVEINAAGEEVVVVAETPEPPPMPEIPRRPRPWKDRIVEPLEKVRQVKVGFYWNQDSKGELVIDPRKVYQIAFHFAYTDVREKKKESKTVPIRFQSGDAIELEKVIDPYVRGFLFDDIDRSSLELKGNDKKYPYKVVGLVEVEKELSDEERIEKGMVELYSLNGSKLADLPLPSRHYLYSLFVTLSFVDEDGAKQTISDTYLIQDGDRVQMSKEDYPEGSRDEGLNVTYSKLEIVAPYLAEEK